MYFTDRGLEELAERRGDESVTLEWVAERLRDFIDDTIDPAGVKRVLLCTGKLYYDLLAARTERTITDTAIVRMEQLYPLPVDEVRAALGRYPNAVDVAWVQEEPANQGAWSFIALNLLEHLDGVRLRRISRPEAAAPSAGSTKVHDAEQAALIEASLPRP